MEQSINLFLDNSNLTNLNSLTHLLDFDDNYNDLAKSIQPSKYYSEDVFMEKTDTNSSIIMSLNCQSLQCKRFANKNPFKCYVYKRHGLKTVIILI